MARAMCIVDCYDAMSCDRPYRRALTYRQCLAELRRCEGTHFDPELVPCFERALRRLRRRRSQVDGLAEQAAALIDPAAHALLRRREDERRPEYQAMVQALRTLRDDHRPTWFITSFAMVEGRCITVLDTGEAESEVSHLGDPWLAQDQLARVLSGSPRRANVLNADDFGVWLTGLAPVRDARGDIVAAVTVDMPALEWAPPSGRETLALRWPPCCTAPPCATAAPRWRPSPTGSPASTTTATCTNVWTRSCAAPPGAARS